MDNRTIGELITIRRFPPVVHPRHAREVLSQPDHEQLLAWVGGYAITVPAHRQLLEDLLGALAWGKSGQAALIHGLYGTGKSHLLVLLHLLAVLPDAWSPFLETHPAFRRYARAMHNHRRLVLHFSLDEYGPQHALERTFRQEVSRAVTQAEIPLPPEWQADASRLDAWGALLDCCRGHGYDGLLILVDELSLFLAGKSPAQREADAAFLQFLADLCGRASVWFYGALQRNLADVGALRTHSWRQVEDRFLRYALSPQEIGGVLRDRLIDRTEPAAIRTVVSDQILPAAIHHAHDIPTAEFQRCWPFHPAALDLLTTVAANYLSPHRSVVELLQQIDRTGWLARPASCLVTPLDLLRLIMDDLARDARLHKCMKAVSLLARSTTGAPNPALAWELIDLLLLLYLSDSPVPVRQLRGLLFNGESAPEIKDISSTLHFLRRRGAYLTVVRESDPGDEVFTLAIDDEIGALALARMQERQREFLPDDPRVAEYAVAACTDADWPFAGLLGGMSLAVPWCGSERTVQMMPAQALRHDDLLHAYEYLATGHTDGQVIMCQPGFTHNDTIWRTATADLTGEQRGVFACWLPRSLTEAERDLWAEYAAWSAAAQDMDTPTSARERQIYRRCRERASELQPAVEAGVRAAYCAGRWLDAHGEERPLSTGSSLAAMSGQALASGFQTLFPLFAAVSENGVPPRSVCQQLLTHFIEPGECSRTTHPLLDKYIERYLVPLGCVAYTGDTAHLHPPRPEILTPLLTLIAAAPARISDAITELRKPPLGLTPEQGRLVIAAAVRTGALQALDGFLRPLSTEDISFTHSEAVVFLAAPAIVDDRYHPLVSQLAATWQIPTEPWPVTCTQVERQLRAWISACMECLSPVRAVLAEWSETLQVMPWGWRETHGLLAHFAVMGTEQTPLEEMLDTLGSDGAQMINSWQQLSNAANWWQAHRRQLTVLHTASLPDDLRREFDTIAGALAEGDASFTQLPTLGEQLDAVLTRFCDAYRQWHSDLFGPPVITRLRAAFDHPNFRAVKLLTRLPLPWPAAATSCLEALTRARTGYCVGDFHLLDTEGVCARCRLPLERPSPMPDPDEIVRHAGESLTAYAELLATHAWVEEIRTRIPRAPEAIAAKATALLNWRIEDGDDRLLAALDDKFLAWLCRDTPHAGRRHTQQLQQRLQGRDLTVTEAQGLIHEWLDPDHTLSEEAVLSFE